MNKDLLVKKRNGKFEILNIEKINRCVERACGGVADVSASEVILDAQVQLYNKIQTSEIDQALILSARSKIEKEPNYSYVAARLLLNTIYKEVFGEGVDSDVFEMQYRKSYVTNLKALVRDGRVDKRLLDFDLKFLSNALDIEADLDWKYLGIQTVYDRYLLHIHGRRMGSPQSFWMRVAMGLVINEEHKNEKAIEFYRVFSSNKALASTPTLFNSGTVHSQLSSCYLSSIEDSLDGIFGSGVHGQARLAKYAGGLGVDWTPIRSTGGYIKGTNGQSQGLIPFLKNFNDVLVSVNQGGKRRGAGCAYLETWHGDIEEFIDLRKNTGDDRRRCHDMNTAHWIPDLFMKRVLEDADWYLFSPGDCSDLHDLFGEEFEIRYAHYSELANSGKLAHQKISAKTLWKKMLTSIFETGHPWITFKDPSNMRYSNQHAGVVHSSNLCTEILLHTKATKWHQGEVEETGETAVCNLASINLVKHIVNGELNEIELAKTIKTVIRGLDNVVDINFYPTQEAKNSNIMHRPIAMGIMGFHDCLHMLGIDYDSEEAVQFANDSQELISYYAILASSELAMERGTYSSYEGSLWSKNIFPIDTYNTLMSYRGHTPDGSENLNWNIVRDHVKTYGMRNSNTMAIAPTACVAGDTLLLTDDGLIPIGAINQEKGATWQDIRMNVCQENTTAVATELYNNGIKPVIKIETSRGHSIIGTPNHRIRIVSKDGNYEWKFLSDIRVGDIAVRKIGGHEELMADAAFINLVQPERIAHHNDTPVILPKNLTNEVAEYLGYFMGRGYLKNRCSCLVVGDVDNDLIQHWSAFAKSLGITIRQEPKAGCSCVLMHSKTLELWHMSNKFYKPKGNCGEGAIGAHIPLSVLKSRTSVLSAFLRGLFEADGTVSLLQSKTPVIEMSTVSEELSYQVQVALECLGIRSSKKVSTVRIDSIHDVRIFAEKIGFISLRKQRVLLEGLRCKNLCENRGNNISHQILLDDFYAMSDGLPSFDRHKILDRKRLGYANVEFLKQMIFKYPKLEQTKLGILFSLGNMDFVPIKKVDDSGLMQTYDISVPDNNTYIANGFISHNTISYIAGCSQSVEPDFSMLYVYSTLSGDFTMTNTFFANDMKKRNLWCSELIEALKATDGNIATLNLPEDVKSHYKTAFAIDQTKLIRAAAARQKWIDQGQSLNLYAATTSLKSINDLYMFAWETGLKTTYYLRSLSASKVEKSTSVQSIAKDITEEPLAESACSLAAKLTGEVCESCQ